MELVDDPPAVDEPLEPVGEGWPPPQAAASKTRHVVAMMRAPARATASQDRDRRPVLLPASIAAPSAWGVLFMPRLIRPGR
jgi:hypothetical protein